MSDWVLDDEAVHEKTTTCDARGCHPVVVIDPESAEDVERLTLLHLSCYGVQEGTKPLAIEVAHMADALREFAAPTPPRPDEPQGLGAVVEDVDGKRWVRADESGLPWLCRSGGTLLNRRWSQLDVRAEPLSEGVTP